ncbi:MAG TPA: type II toxin-antitoxin system HicB family antitoxin [Dermatophilaceae bacterium]|nr:type II toxin-antitoxin system HicB family antitoxin [Dermatophilaceae bacterium]
MSEYRAVIYRDEDGYWVADFPDVPGCHTQAKTLAVLRERMREALDLFVDDAGTCNIVEGFNLSPELLEAMTRAVALRDQAAKSEEAARKATARAVDVLTSAGLSYRAVGELLGLSFQRVQQIAGRKQEKAAH